MVSNESALILCFRALADGTRQGILTLLGKGRRSVHEIAEEFPISRPAISKHLKILREAGLVLEERAGRERIYTLEQMPFGAASQWLRQFNGGAQTTGSNGRGRESRVARPSSMRRNRAMKRRGTRDWRVW